MKEAFEIWRQDISKEEKEKLRQIAEKLAEKEDAHDFKLEHYKNEAGLVETRVAEEIIEPKIKKVALQIEEKRKKLNNLEQTLQRLKDDFGEIAAIANIGNFPTSEIEKLTEEEKQFLNQYYSYINYCQNLLPKIKQEYEKKKEEWQKLKTDLDKLKNIEYYR